MAQHSIVELSKDELKVLIQDTVRETLTEMISEVLEPRLGAFAAQLEERMENLIFGLEQELPDPEEGLSLRPDFEEKLREAQRKGDKFYSLEEVKSELGIDE